MSSSWSERIKYSPAGRLAALPMRLRIGLTPLLAQGGQMLRWLGSSREWVNFSYDYAPEGLQAVVCVIAELTGRPAHELRGFAQELKHDAVFAARYAQRVQHTRLRWTCDPQLHFGRCLVNYMLVRATGAKVVFEAGTDRGLSSWAMCRAMQANGHVGQGARLITVDLRADRGEFLDGDEAGLVQRLTGDSVAALAAVDQPIDLFLHDTVNDDAHSRAQFKVLSARLAPGALLHSCWFSDAFVQFCEQRGLRALEYVERVQSHWYAGRRCGLAVLR